MSVKTSFLPRLFLGCFIVLFATGAKPPEWLNAAALRKHTDYGPRVGAVVLHDELLIAVEPSGRITRTQRYALKVLRQAGPHDAKAVVHYSQDHQKIRGLRAWAISPRGVSRELPSDWMIDAAMTQQTAFSQARAAALVDRGWADEPGSVFGWESVVSDTGIFGIEGGAFDGPLPVLLARVSLRLPPGWSVRTHFFNTEPAMRDENGARLWELQNLAAVESEPLSPGGLIGRRYGGFDLVAPPGKAGAAPLRIVHQSWAEVGAYMAALADPAAVPDAAITAKAQAILNTAGAVTAAEKIRALGRFVQTVNYVSIAMDVGKGGGLKPRAACDVFQTNYGDCKDKAALFRALLRASGIDSYSVGISTEARDGIQESWPSVSQFNHAITAVAVDEQETSPFVVTHPTFGRLLLVDVTDPILPVGELGNYLWYTKALIDAPKDAALVPVPGGTAERNRSERTIVGKVSTGGSLQLRVSERSTGSASLDRRALHREQAAAQESAIRRWLGGVFPGSEIDALAFREKPATGEFEMSFDLGLVRHAKMIRDELITLRPASLGASLDGSGSLASLERVVRHDRPRTLPIRLGARVSREVVELQAPPEFKITDIPKPTELTTPFARYSAKCVIAGDQVRYERELLVHNRELPPEKLGEVRTFVEAVQRAEKQAVLFARK